MKIKKKVENIVVWLLILSLMTTLVPVTTRAEEVTQEISKQQLEQQTQVKPEDTSDSGTRTDDTISGDNVTDSFKDKQEDSSDQEGKDQANTVKTPSDDDEVTVIVELEKQPEKSGGFPSLFASKGSTRDQVKKQIKNLINPTTRSFSNLFGLLGTSQVEDTLNVVYDYDKVMSGFAIEVKYQYLNDIKKMKGVKNAFVENTYSVPETQPSEVTYKNDDVRDMIGTKDSQYTGKGTVIAIIDSGLYTKHEAFVANDDVDDTLTESDVDSLAENKELKAGGGSLKASDVRVNKKIPFAYDYADKDNNVNPTEESDHGTHVSGIATANGGSTVRGAAPDAQLVMLKVFSDGSGSATDSNIMAALEDAVTLNVDVVNMSLGSDAGFSTAGNQTYQDIYDNVKKTGIILSIASGNSFSSAYGNAANNSIARVTEPDDSIVASPASYDASFAVASSSGAEQATYFVADNNKITYLESTKEGKVFTDLEGAQNYIICGNGSPEAINETLKREGLDDLKGKVALVERGGTTAEGKNLTFAMKADIAAANGAIGIIVYDNVENNGLTDMGGITQKFPAAYISNASGKILLGLKEKKVSFDTSYVMGAPTEMSTFSSWGPTADLKLKPEITAPGGGIYSTAPNNKYETMSGTSMATPQISGISADIKQYINNDEKFEDLPVASDTDADSGDGINKSQMVSALIMSTATPIKMGDTWYSPRKQGAGLANVKKAVDAKAYLTVKGQDVAKPKAELGAGKQTRSFTFTVNNLTDEDLTYSIDTAALSEAIKGGYFQQATVNYTGKGIDVSYDGLVDGKVSVEAYDSTDITVTIAFGEEFKNAVTEAVNGTFVDGFVQMIAEEGSGSNLSLPFLSFYGDLADAPVFDGTEVGGSYSLGQSSVYSTSTDRRLGQNPFDSSIPIQPDKYVVSTKGLYGAVLGLRTQTYLLKNVDKLDYTITQQKTGKTIMQKEFDQVRKSNYVTSAGMVSYVEALNTDVPQFKGIDDDGKEVDEGWYTYTVTATIPGTDGKTQKWSFDFYFDQSKPAINSSEVVQVDGKKVLRLKLSDKHYISGVDINADRQKSDDDDDSVLIKQKIYTDPDNVEEKKKDRNIDSTYTLDLDYDSVIQELQKQGAPDDHVVVNVYDYALNYVSEKIYLRDIYPESIQLSQDSITLTRGEETEISATLAPENTNKKKIEFISEDPEVATVDENGKIIAKAAGKTKIIAKSEAEDVTASCDITVNEIETSVGIVLNKKAIDVSIGGDAVSLTPTLAKGITGEIKWESSDPEVLTVDESKGMMTALKIGKVTVTASITYGEKTYTATCEVNSRVKPTDQFEIDEDGVLTALYGAAVDIRIPEGVTAIDYYVFSNYDIKSVYIPASVKEIRDGAFEDCAALSSLTFGDGSTLESIGDSAFSGTCLDSITLPETLTTIGAGAFYNSARTMVYTSVKVPEKVTEIPADAFGGNLYLDKVELPDGIKSIGNGAFASSTSLKELHMPSALETIGDRAFNGTGLTSFTAPEGLNSIGNQAFMESPLTEVKLNDGLETVGEEAFKSTNVKTFTFPDSVNSVGASVLASASQLTNVKIGKGITELTTPFTLSKALQNIEISEENEAFRSIDGALLTKDSSSLIAYPIARENSSYTIPKGVVTIEDSAFDQATNIKVLDFSKNTTLKKIGDNAFEGASIEELKLPDTVEQLGSRAFSWNQKLKTLDLNKLKELGNYAFQYTAIENPNLGKSLTSIGEGAFAYCNSLVTVNLPDSLKSIGDRAFMNSENVKSVHIGAKLTKISGNQNLFTGAMKLDDITVSEKNKALKSVDSILMSADGKQLILYAPGKQETTYVVADGVEEIADFAFYRVGTLKEIVLPDGLKTIGISAFNGCTSLEKINIPDSTQEIKMFAFTNANLESIYIGTNIKILDDSALGMMDNLKHIVITGAKDLEFTSTSELNSLSTVYFGDGVKSIAAFSLQYPSLKTVVLGKDIEDIDPDAFAVGSDVTFYTIAGSKADQLVRGYTYGKVKNYKTLTLTSFKADQKQITSQTKLVAAINGGIGSVEYRFTKIGKDGEETELQAYSSSNALTVQVPDDGVNVRVYVRDGSYYTLQQDLELQKGANVEGSFVAKASLNNSDGSQSKLQKEFNGTVRIESTEDSQKVGFKLSKVIKKVSYKGSAVSEDENGIFWITVDDLSDIELQLTTDQENSAVLSVDASTLKTPVESGNLEDLVKEIDGFVDSKKELQDVKEIYTKESFEVLLQKLSNAKVALDNWMITQEGIESAADELQEARNELKIAIISGRRYTATSAMTKEDGTVSMISSLLGKKASLERTEKGTWIVKFNIVPSKIGDYGVSGENINGITYKYNGLTKDAVKVADDKKGTKTFQIEMKDLTTSVELDFDYYQVVPEYPTHSTAYLVIRENTLDPVGLEDITVDKTALTAKIAEAKAIDAAGYTAETYAKLKEQIELAEALVEKEDATQKQVEAQVAALTTAIQNLVEIPAAVDKTKLAAQIEKTKALDEGDYTSDSWSALKDALKSAEDVNAEKDATQEQVDAQTEALQKALDALVGVVNYKKDGTYEVTLNMIQTGNDKPSSMDNAIERKGHIIVKDGKARLYMSMLPFMGAYSGDFTYNDKDGKKIPVDVISEYPVVDSYNNSETGTDDVMKGHLYPKMISFPVELDTEFVTLNMRVPAMKDSVSARVKINYNTIAKADSWTMDAVEIIADENQKVTSNQILDKMKDLKEGQPISIDVTKGSLDEISKDIFDKASEKGAKIIIKSGKATWEFAADGKAKAALKSPVVKVNEEISEITQKLEGAKVDMAGILEFAFEHEGELPKQAKVTIQVSDKLKAGQDVILYYYNHETGLFEKLDTYKVAEDKTVQLKMEHCSDYILSVKELPESLVAEKETPVTTDKKVLNSKIAEAKGLTQEQFTVESWSVLSDALKKAETVNENPDADQADVDAAANELVNAIQGLVKVKEPESENPAQPENPQIPVTPQEPADAEGTGNQNPTEATQPENVNAETKSDSVKTGDQSRTMIYVVAMAATLALAGSMFLLRRRKRQ